MFKTPATGRIDAVLLVAALAGAPLAAHAQVYKCPQANGTIGYQATPCATGEKPSAHPTAAQLNAQRAAAPKDGKPNVDPYANNGGTQPHAASPAPQAPMAPNGTTTSAADKTSNLVADVQARNRREAEQQAFLQAHKNDKTVNMAACNAARRNLGVLGEQQRVFTYDNKGNRVYVDDKDRAGRVADAQRSVAASCP